MSAIKLNIRDQQRTEYEDKLRNEINKIRTQTDVEIERLKTTCHQTFERENRFGFYYVYI